MTQQPETQQPESSAGPLADLAKLDPASIRAGVVGLVLGAVLGCAYGYFPKITSLAVGPIPGVAVGFIAGAVGGGILGALAGAVGGALLTRRAAVGAAIAVGVVVLGRLADDTGQTLDKIWDIVAASAVYGTVGAIVGAVLFGPEAEEAAREEATAADAKPEEK